MDSIIINLNGGKALYLQIYEHIRNAIINGELPKNEQLPSIRGLAKSLSVSKITVERAYEQLCSEGYIEGKERSRYYVAKLSELAFKAPGKKKYDSGIPASLHSGSAGRERIDRLYDFASGEMALEGFDFSLWKRYMGKAMGEPARLMKYGDVLGESELRCEIAKYLIASRGVSVQPERIIIGANTQALIGQLSTLLNRDTDIIAFENPGFKNGRRVFSDYGYKIAPVSMDSGGISIEKLELTGARAVYLCPSHQFPTGLIMPAPKRLSLLKWAADNGSYIIEDDYDSEFRYYGNPIPAMKGMDSSDRVIYIGSFSKIIPPSIRISYMVLPQELERIHKERQSHYSQTASTLEQLTLSLYMRDEQLERQIRRLRSRYNDKRSRFISAIESSFGSRGKLFDNGSGLFIILEPETGKSIAEMKKAAEQNNCRIRFIDDYYFSGSGKCCDKRLLLYFSSIKEGEIEKSAELLKKILLDT